MLCIINTTTSLPNTIVMSRILLKCHYDPKFSIQECCFWGVAWLETVSSKVLQNLVSYSKWSSPLLILRGYMQDICSEYVKDSTYKYSNCHAHKITKLLVDQNHYPTSMVQHIQINPHINFILAWNLWQQNAIEWSLLHHKMLKICRQITGQGLLKRW